MHQKSELPWAILCILPREKEHLSDPTPLTLPCETSITQLLPRPDLIWTLGTGFVIPQFSLMTVLLIVSECYHYWLLVTEIEPASVKAEGAP